MATATGAFLQLLVANAPENEFYTSAWPSVFFFLYHVVTCVSGHGL